MNENLCSYANTRGETIVAYLYDDIAPLQRTEFERHLTTCAVCRSELDALGDVRIDLAQWTPPEHEGQIAARRPLAFVPKRSRWATWSTVPSWAQAAAAVVFLGAAASLANLEIHYNTDGLNITTGWRHASSVSVVKQPDVAATPIASRSDLEVLEQKLRHEIDLRASAAPAPSAEDAATLRRVRALLEESEQRQQRELALRVAEVVRDAQVQRQADLVKIDRSLGVLQNQTVTEVMRTRRDMNTLAQQVSQQR